MQPRPQQFRRKLTNSSCMAKRTAPPFDQRHAGMHHLCFRAHSREDVDAIYQTVLALKARMIREPVKNAWAVGYYSVLFEDPDVIRIEANFMLGKKEGWIE